MHELLTTTTGNMPTISFPRSILLLHYYICQWLPLVDLLSFAATSKQNRAEVQRYMTYRIRNQLVKFVPNVNSFLTLLDETKAVVSGSAALHLTMPENRDRSTTPRHLTVYVPRDASRMIANSMRSQGFQQLSTAPRKFRGTHNIITFSYRQQTVKVLVSASNSTLLPIMHSPTTFLMNYYTSSTMFLAYPLLTFLKRGLVNPLAFSNQFRHTNPGLATQTEEFSGMGFRLQSNIASRLTDILHDQVQHACEEDVSCPAKIRNSKDKGHLLFSLQPQQTHSDWETRDGETIQWRIGGRACLLNDHAQKSSFAYIL